MLLTRQFIVLFGSTKSIRLSSSTFTANAVQGTAIGTLSVIGASGTPTFSLTDSHSNAVQVSGTALQVGSAASSAGSFTITVHVTGVSPSIPDKTFLITATSTTTLQSDVGTDILANTGSPILVQ